MSPLPPPKQSTGPPLMENMRIESKIEHGDPVDKICDAAERMKAELVIVGNRGLGAAGTLVLGSVSDDLVRKCSRSVMVVKDEGS